MAQSFSFDLPGDPAVALEKASSLIRESGGTLTGDATAGSFSGKSPAGDVKGTYRIEGSKVTVDITSKPFMVPQGLVESKVRSFFGA